MLSDYEITEITNDILNKSNTDHWRVTIGYCSDDIFAHASEKQLRRLIADYTWYMRDDKFADETHRQIVAELQRRQSPIKIVATARQAVEALVVAFVENDYFSEVGENEVSLSQFIIGHLEDSAYIADTDYLATLASDDLAKVIEQAKRLVTKFILANEIEN